MRGVTTGGEVGGRWEIPERKDDLGRIADALERIAGCMERSEEERNRAREAEP